MPKRFLVPSLLSLSLTSGFAYSTGNQSCCMEYEECQDCRCLDNYRLWIDDEGWFADAEFLYWTVYEQELDYAITKNFPVFQDVNSGPNNGSFDGLAGKVNKAHFAWKPGVRVEVGYQFPCDHWELSGSYTYYHSQHSDSTNLPQNSGMQGNDPIAAVAPTFSSVLLTPGTTTQDPIQHAKSHIKINYQIGDLLLTRHFLPSRNIVLGLFAGAKGCWIEQDWHVFYQATSVHTDIKNNFNFGGGGLQLGITSDWYLPKGISWYANAAVSALIGSHNTKSTTIASSGIFNNLFQKINPHDTRFVTSGQFQTGLAWNYAFYCSSMRIWIGYEANIWNNVHEVYRYSSRLFSNVFEEKHRDIENNFIVLHGLTAGFYYHF